MTAWQAVRNYQAAGQILTCNLYFSKREEAAGE